MEKLTRNPFQNQGKIPDKGSYSGLKARKSQKAKNTSRVIALSYYHSIKFVEAILVFNNANIRAKFFVVVLKFSCSLN